MAEIQLIKREIRAVIDAVAAGTQEHGAILFQGYNSLLRAVETGRKIKELEDVIPRLEELERRRRVEQDAWHNRGRRS